MLYKNEIFKLEGRQLRLLHADPRTGLAYVIDVYEKFSWPWTVLLISMLRFRE